VHAFGASNLLDADVLADHIEATVATGARLATEAGFALRLVDCGGGLGIPYADDEVELDLNVLRARLAALVGRLAADPATASTRLLLEPGRYLVGASGAYLTRVVDRKRVGGREVAILDGGIHHVLRPTLVGQEHRIRVLTGHAAGCPGDGADVTLAGPLCTGLDVLSSGSAVAAPSVGDLVAVLDVGAYGATESMPFFLSHALPAEIAVRAGEAWLARPRVDPDTWLEWQAGEPGACRRAQ
jgi:diaminopimelate decarboxylase